MESVYPALWLWWYGEGGREACRKEEVIDGYGEAALSRDAQRMCSWVQES
jgi:hypothetical protein